MRTIAALATPKGLGGIAVIRVCGDHAFDAVNNIFDGKCDVNEMETRSLHYGKIVDIYSSNQEIIDYVVLGIFRAPGTFNGENIVEISCHGGYEVCEIILDLLFKNGVKPAEPGEFTKIAFLNGKLNLPEAESVADLIHAKSKLAVRSAMHLHNGDLSRSLYVFRKAIVKIVAQLESELDFLDEESYIPNHDDILATLLETIVYCEEAICTQRSGDILRNGFKVAIVGKTNAGKSTLFNVLLKRNRSLVSDIPGTTRDYIEDSFFLKDIEVKLIDTAGINDSSKDLIEIEGIKLTRQIIKESNLIILVVDAGYIIQSEIDEFIDSLEEDSNLIIAVNKTDLLKDPEKNDNYIYISAKNDDGIDVLTKEIYKAAVSCGTEDNTIFINDRHSALLKKAIRHLEIAHNLLENETQPEIVVYELRKAVEEVGNITGDTFNNEVLNEVFSKFCVGK